MERIRTGILGATGTVGQRLIALLEHHPQFGVTAVAASDRSEGKRYAEACSWRLPGEMPAAVCSMVVQAPRPPLDCDIVLSSLPSDIAGPIELDFARAGYPVISKPAAHRMGETAPPLPPQGD